MYTPTYLFQGIIVDSYQHTNIGDNKQKDNYMEDDFIGTTFPTPKGGVLTVVGWDGDRIGTGKKKYTVECNICSKDIELFPNGFKSIKSTLVSGQIPCGCSVGTRWSEYQYDVKVKRKCKEKGYIFHGWEGGFKGNRTKLILENPATENIWGTTNISNFMRGQGDPIVGVRKTAAARTIEDFVYIEDFYKAGFTKDYRFFRNNVRKDSKGYYSLWNYICPLCSNDEYVKAGLCSGVFTSFTNRLKLGKKGCRCSIAYHWTQKQREYQIKKACYEEGLTFIGWENREVGYKNSQSKFQWICTKGHTCETSVGSFLHKGARCKICMIEKQKEQGIAYGYYPERTQEPDSLYILNFDNQYLKVGRSFRLEERIKQLKKTSGVDSIEILQIVNGTHQDIYDLEQFLHGELRDRGFEYETDWGSTECFDSDSLKLVYKLIDEEISESGNTLEIIKL